LYTFFSLLTFKNGKKKLLIEGLLKYFIHTLKDIRAISLYIRNIGTCTPAYCKKTKELPIIWSALLANNHQ